MLPAIAQHAIAAYSHPGELILDPMCGIGTTLVEAVHLDRDTVGVELEPRWAELARANLTHARAQGATGTATVVTGDARDLPRMVPAEARGRVALVLTSPPYGATVHGQVDARPGHGVRKWDDRYTADRGRGCGNLALAGHGGLLAGIEDLGRLRGAAQPEGRTDPSCPPECHPRARCATLRPR